MGIPGHFERNHVANMNMAKSKDHTRGEFFDFRNVFTDLITFN
jgi:hypothetical protein